MLVLFAAVMIGVLALAGLVIDVGFARVAQRQMQTAADAAAVEGLRWRDVQQWEDLPRAWLGDESFQALTGSPAEPPYTGTMSAQQVDAARRWAASSMVAHVFDDDFVLSADARNYGAGLRVERRAGIALPNTSFRAAETVSLGDPPVYDPRLQFNRGNAKHGDIVEGRYGRNAGYPGDATHDESAEYDRRDFVPDDGDEANAMLVRLRRTAGPASLDDVEGVSSRAGPLPFLFAAGSALDRDVAARGIEVRAVGIAAAGRVEGLSSDPGQGAFEAGRVKAAGPVYSNDTTEPPVAIMGLAPFALRRSRWEDPQQVLFASDGTASGEAFVIDPGQLLQIGDVVASTGSAAPLTTADDSLHRYVAIFEIIEVEGAPDAHELVVGFGMVRSWTFTPGQEGGGTLTFTKVASPNVARGNATGVLVRRLQMPGKSIGDLLSRHGDFADPLLAPVLVNRTTVPTP